MASGELLFTKYDLRGSLDSQRQKMLDEIAGYPTNELLNTGTERLLDYFEEKYRAEIPELDESGAVFDQQETQIDVRNDWGRAVMDRSRPALAPGTRFEFSIPFTGDAVLFDMRASTSSFNSPSAIIKNGHVVLAYERTDHNVDALKADYVRDLDAIKKALGWVCNDAEPFNASLRGVAQRAIEERRARVLANQNVAAAIGIPFKRRDDAAKTYAAPEVRRKPPITRPAASTKPYAPEPTLEMTEYDNILSVIRGMTLVMERNPHAFAEMHEPGIRDHILVQLNGHYEGQATGETFNFEGKTDILIRVDGKNIFIAECKFWDGPKSLTDTIDQLLGYATWRDSKLAIVLLYRGRNFGDILAKVPLTVLAHGNVIKQLDYKHESDSRYLLRHRDDADKELMLTILSFNVPTGD
jgi:hypothetical protein